MKQSGKLRGQLKIYYYWPIYVAVFMAVMDICALWYNYVTAVIPLGFTLVYVVAMLILVFRKKNAVKQAMIDFAMDYAQVQRALLDDLTIPYGLLDESGKIIWLNKEFSGLVNKHSVYRKNIQNVFPEIRNDIFEEEDDVFVRYVSYDSRDYKVEFRKMGIDGIMQNNTLFSMDGAPSLYAIYLFDETDINYYIKTLNEEQFCVGLLYIDNYDEALESIDELRKSLLAGLVERKISQYINRGNGIVKRLEKDKYLIVFRNKFLDDIKADRFSLLDEVKATEIGNGMAVTLSIGIATGFDDYNKNFEMAKSSIDLALGRGGDQAVIREGENTTYFGGKSTTLEKNTRVKARVKAHALRELIESTDNVIIMGHRISDVDALGAAIGVYRAAKAFGKHANIVVNEVTTSLRPIMDLFQNTPEYEEDLFVTNDEVMEHVNDNTLLVVVDVNRPGYTECPGLIEVCKTIVVIDHHRQSSDTIDCAVLSYIEPYASSASEMVAEILQYIGDNVKLKAAEANAIYAGIIIDTNNFTNKAGARTFEAAAFIRRSGADIIKVRKLLRNDMNEYKARAEAVRRMEVYMDAFAFAVCPSYGLESPTIVGAQAANELLDVCGIKASFVFTQYNDEIHISARSIDEVNVQLVMEKLGGGGHMSIAGVQLKDTTVEDAIELVKKTLYNMVQEGEI